MFCHSPTLSSTFSAACVSNNSFQMSFFTVQQFCHVAVSRRHLFTQTFFPVPLFLLLFQDETKHTGKSAWIWLLIGKTIFMLISSSQVSQMCGHVWRANKMRLHGGDPQWSWCSVWHWTAWSYKGQISFCHRAAIWRASLTFTDFYTS